jgi:hypothetical protein
MSCPDWLRQDMKKSGSSKPATGKKDMGSLFHGPKVQKYADGGEVEALKTEGLKASAGEKVGFFERLRMGNIDEPGSEAYNRFGAGRGAAEANRNAQSYEQTDDYKNLMAADKASSAPRTASQDAQNDQDTAYSSAPKKQTFGAAFADARKSGAKTFTWNGKSYTTEVKGQAPAAKSSSKPAAPASKPAPKAESKAPASRPASTSGPSRSDMKVMFRDAERGGTTGLNYLRERVEANDLNLADAQRARKLLDSRK